MIILSILGSTIACVVMNLLFDIINLTNVNIKITENIINIKRMFCSISIFIGNMLSNIIILSTIYVSSIKNTAYKTKSDNIIEGQRSLKL